MTVTVDGIPVCERCKVKMLLARKIGERYEKACTRVQWSWRCPRCHGVASTWETVSR